MHDGIQRSFGQGSIKLRAFGLDLLNTGLTKIVELDLIFQANESVKHSTRHQKNFEDWKHIQDG